MPANHPIRKMRALPDEALEHLDTTFDEICADMGRPPILPERRSRAWLLQVMYLIRSERQLIEELEYNLVFRGFLGMSVDEPVSNSSIFSNSRDRLFQADIGRRLFERSVEMARLQGLSSDDHVSVDGTLIAACASHKSVGRKDGSDGDNFDGVGRSAGRQFHRVWRSNETHGRQRPSWRPRPRALRVAQAMLYTLIENRDSLLVDAEPTQATGTAE